MDDAGIPYIVVATKVDKLSKTERERSMSSILSESVIPDGVEVIPFSSQTKEGKNEVWEKILFYAEK